MTQLGAPVPSEVEEIRAAIADVLAERSFEVIDAESVVTGKDFLLKIWELVISVPLGIAVIHEEMSSKTIANIFYELGLMQADDFLRRAFLISGDPGLRRRAAEVLSMAGLENRARNSVELLAAWF